MKQKWIALLLAVALGASVCGISAVADGDRGAPVTQAAPAGKTDSQVYRREPAATPDAVGTMSFENLESRMRQNCLDILILQGSIEALEELVD